MTRTFSLIGPGRAGQSVSSALVSVGWVLESTYDVSDDVTKAAADVDLLIVATPDFAIRDVAAAIEPARAVLLHLSGATSLDALSPHRAAGMHPLVSLSDPTVGASALRNAWFAVAGDPLASQIAESLSGKWFEIEDRNRALYHGAAAIGANHLVALLGQVERIGAEIGVPLEAFMSLVKSSIENVEASGPAAALTGPAARGDEVTIERHRSALADRLPDELEAYDAMLALARGLAQQQSADPTGA